MPKYIPAQDELFEIKAEIEDPPQVCDCGSYAEWLYMPGGGYDDDNPYACDNCVPRGCSCVKDELDDLGRAVPCCEWMWVGP